MTREVDWDAAKAEENIRKHGVSFDEAASVLHDPLYLGLADREHSEGESRFLAVGCSTAGRILVVAYTHRAQDVIRIISARVASRREQHAYEKG